MLTAQNKNLGLNYPGTDDLPTRAERHALANWPTEVSFVALHTREIRVPGTTPGTSPDVSSEPIGLASDTPKVRIRQPSRLSAARFLLSHI